MDYIFVRLNLTYLPANNLRRISTMYVRGYLQGSENGRTVALYDPFFFGGPYSRATDFTYIKIGEIATRFKSELSMGRLMIGSKCVLPCVVISFHKIN